METLPYTLAPAFNPDSCPPLSFNLNLALKGPLAPAHDDDELPDQQSHRDAEPADADAGDDNVGNVDNKEVDDPLLTMMTPPSSESATALPAAALGEAPKAKPQPVGGIHEWSTELDETEPYSLTASPSPLTPVSTHTTTTTTTTSSSGSSTAEPPTRESNEAEAAAAITHHRDEAEVKETAANAPRSGGALLLPSREDEPSEDLLHSNFECVDQAAASGGDELAALRAEMRTLQAQVQP
jgi:hypothetical protein